MIVKRPHGAFIYTRYSTDRQNEDSTETQVEVCTEWCRRHSMVILDTFSDEAVSGMKESRDEYERMMSELKRGGADTVIIYDQSRMFRKMTAWFQFREALESMGVAVISATQPMIGKDLRDPANFLTEGSMALFNQMWVLQTRQRVIATMRHMARNGQHTGGQPPLGYSIKDGELVVCEPEAAIVRRIFSEYANGHIQRNHRRPERRQSDNQKGKPVWNKQPARSSQKRKVYWRVDLRQDTTQGRWYTQFPRFRPCRCYSN